MKNNINAWKRKKLIFVIAMLSIPLAQFVLLTFWPTIKTIFMAFESPTGETMGFASFSQNWDTFVIEWTTSGKWKRAILNSLGYFPSSTLVSLPLSIITAYFLYKKIPLSSVYKIIFFIPSIISIVVMGLAFRNMFSLNGPINSLIKSFGVSINDIPNWFNDTKITMYVLYFYSVWVGIGYNCILLFGALSRVPVEVMESAAIDGCGTFREIFTICVPIMWPTISSMIIFGVSTVFTMFLHTEVLTGGAGDTWTVTQLIMQKIKSGKNPNYAATLSLILTAIAVPIVQTVRYLLDKICDSIEV